MKTFTEILWFITSVILVFFGFYLLFNPELALTTLTLWIGLFVLLGGVLALTGLGYERSGLLLFDGIIGIVFGLLLLSTSMFDAAEVMIVLFFGLWILFRGLNKIIQAIRARKDGLSGWYIILIMGILEIIFGVIAFINPIIAVFAIAVIIGLDLIVSGIASIAALAVARKMDKAAY